MLKISQGGYTHENKRYSTEKIISVIKDGEAGIPVEELFRKYGISDATIYSWKSKFCNLLVSVPKNENKSLPICL
ncbi:MAG: transposase [Chlorobiaceae bacterium]|jgi:putative transposase|nr:transposase [Chlorobiaceae bacterium]